MSNNIVKELRKTDNRKNEKLAMKIEWFKNKRSFNPGKDGKVIIGINKKLYSLFFKLMIPECEKELIELDRLIYSISEKIEKSSGWYMDERDGFKYHDNYQNTHDPEFRTFDTYRILRNEEGYYVNNEIPYNQYFENLRIREESFFATYEEDLQILHELLTRKENIIAYDFILKEEKNRKLAIAIADYLGYIDNQKKKKTNSQKIKKH